MADTQLTCPILISSYIYIDLIEMVIGHILLTIGYLYSYS